MEKQIKDKLNNKPLFIGFALIFCLAFIIRTAFSLYYWFYDPAYFTLPTDCANYINAAKNLLNYGILCEQNVLPPYPGVFRTPAYPLLVAGIYGLTHYANGAVVLVQVLMSSLTCAFVFIIASRYTSKGIAVVVSLILAIDIVSIDISNQLLTETFFTFILVLSILIFNAFLSNRKIGYLILAALFFALGVMIRPILLYFALGSIVIFLFYFRKNFKQALIYYFVFNLAFLLIIGPWILRNINIGYYGFAAVQEVNIYIYKAGWIEERLKGNPNYSLIPFNERFEKVNQVLAQRKIENTPLNRIKLYKELGMKTLKENPFLLAKYQAIYTAKVFTSAGVEPIFTHFESVHGKAMPTLKKAVSSGYLIMLLVVYMTVVIGLFQRKILDRKNGLFFILILFFYMAVLSGELGGESRFRVPIMPVMLLISACGLDFIFKNIKKLYAKFRIIEQFIKYALVGGIAAVADISIFYVGTSILMINHLLANTLSFVVGLLVNYFLSREWVFNYTRHNFKRDFTLFTIIGVIGLGISNLMLYLFIDLGVLLNLLHFLDGNLAKLTAKLITVFVVLFWNFFARKIIVFKTIKDCK